MSYLILVVEDQPEIAEILTAYLQKNGMRTAHASDGQQALDLHATAKPDLVLLDVQLPVVDGWKVLATLRTRGDTPVIMLTAMDQDMDKLMGLRIGADDYVVKPFNPAEVVARIDAVLRRAGNLPGGTAAPSVLRAGPLVVDLDRYTAVVIAGAQPRPLDLTPTEFKLLVEFLRAPNRAFSRERLLDCLPDGDPMERTVDSHVSKLRKKLEDGGFPGALATVRGVGYKLGIEP